jgi:hypothetical protein
MRIERRPNRGPQSTTGGANNPRQPRPNPAPNSSKNSPPPGEARAPKSVRRKQSPIAAGQPLALERSTQERVADLLVWSTNKKSVDLDPRHPDFLTGLERLAVDCTSQSITPALRGSVALALIRASATARVKAAEELVSRLLPALLQSPIELESSHVAAADDRMQLAAVLGEHRPAWAAPTLARLAAREDTNHEVRVVALRALFRIAASPNEHENAPLSTSEPLQLLAHASEQWARDSQVTTKAAVRRILALTNAVAEVISTVCPIDTDPGKALAAMTTTANREKGPSSARQDTDAAIKRISELAPVIVTTLRALFAHRGDLAANPSSYAPLRALRDWASPPLWTTWATSERGRSALAPLIDLLISAITARVIRGAYDDLLVSQLALVCGNRDRARHLTAKLADELRGLSPEARNWLETGESTFVPATEPTPTVAAAVLDEASQIIALRSQRAAEDEIIGNLMRIVAAFRRTTDGIDNITASNGSVADIEVLASTVATQARVVEQTLGALAHRRDLQLSGTPGDVVPYDRRRHILAQRDPTVPVTTVRQVEPVVLRKRNDGTTDVVLSAIAEPAPTAN